ncbi:hypothetical protein NQ317_019146 [Molorchus minor]|uniref:Uncharacterized protein n=1 Tax=Molorchus minor TaxID=1323400 RepID=A0ABQ9JNW3_9CUCU|nr:hypothetical protein NQ317_019146 [Molorchus minor]
MASRRVLLKDLKVGDLKKILEDRDCEIDGKKVFYNNGCEMFYTRRVKIQIQAKMLENCVNLEERLENKLSETKQQLDQKIREIESQFALLSSKTDLSPPGAADENVGEVNSSPNKDVKIKEGKESPACSVAGDKEQHSIRHTTCETKMRMKPPQFDGKTPWPNYLRQFEAAAKTNDWSMDEKATALTLALRGDATDILQTLSSAEQADYEQLIKHLEMRYGQTNLEYVYHSQLKNRYQKPSETLKEFQVDISRLVRLAYPATPEAVMERLAVQAFLDGLRDGETRQALILARPTNLVDALTRALEFEAAKQCAKGQARIRQVEEDSNGDTMEATIRKFVKEALSEAKKVQCWKCGKVGHIRRRCPENQAVATATVPEKRNRVDDKGQPSIRDPQAPRKIAQVASLEHQSNSIFINALVDGKPRELLLDTGATRTIIRPDIVGTSTKVKRTPWRLRTATGQPATIHGEVGVTFNIGNTCFNGQVLVADIEDELILGMDIMNTKGFKLDFKRGVLQINEEEVVLHGRTEERVRVVLAEDSSISERCEAILYACPDGRYDEGSIMMVEPGTHDSEGGHGVVIGKSLSHVRKIVPVRVMNVNYHPVTLKKGTVLGYCCPVASIVRSLGATRENSAEISAELEALIKTSSRHLKMDQRKITTVLDDNWQIEKIKIDQENDPELKHIMTWKKEGRRPTWAEIARYSPVLKSYWAQWNSLDLNDGCLKRVLENGEGEDIAGEDYVTTLRRRMDDIHDQVRSNIQSASDRMKETYDIGAQNDGYQSGDLVWLYNPQRRRGLSPKLQTLWEGPYEVLARINDVVYRIKKSSGGKPRVVHFNRLTPFSGSNDASVRTVVPFTHEMSFENFMAQYSPNHKARYGVTREEQRDLFQVPAEFALAHCVAQDLQMSRGIAAAFKEKFGNVDELRRQRPEVGDVLQLGGNETSRRVFYLVTKHLSRDKPTYENVWESLISLRGALLSQEVTHLAIPKLSCGLDGLNWRVVRNMLEVLFQFTGIEVLEYQSPKEQWIATSINSPAARKAHSVDIATIQPKNTFRDGKVFKEGTV